MAADMTSMHSGHRVDRVLLLAVLMMQVAVLVQLHRSTRQAPSHLPSADPGQPPVAAAPAAPPWGWHTRRLAAPMDDRVEDAMENVARLRSAVHFHRGWERLRASPSLDMRDTGGGYVVTFSIPGVHPDDLGVLLDGRILTVQALCASPGHPGGVYHYERRVLLPGPVGESDEAVVLLTNGVLRVHVPKGGDGVSPPLVRRLF